MSCGVPSSRAPKREVSMHRRLWSGVQWFVVCQVIPGVGTEPNASVKNGQIGGSKAMTPEQKDTFSAGETGRAEEDVPTNRTGIIIGEIPAADDPTVMLWTARCSDPVHDLLGHFDSRAEAKDAGTRHLESSHRSS